MKKRQRIVHEQPLLNLAAAIRALVDGLPTRDRRSALRLLRTFSRVGPQSQYKQTRAAWQNVPAHLQQRIIELARAAGCAEELQRVVGEVWPEQDQGPPLPLRGQ